MIKTFAVNPFREATYVLSDGSKECVIIDCGVMTVAEESKLTAYISENGLKPVMAINTHAHLDHIFGVNYIKNFYDIPFALSSDDLPTLAIASQSAMMFGLAPESVDTPTIDIDLKDKESISFGETTLQIIPSPGHTSGGVCLYDQKEGVLFSGDTLFAGSIGRTDLPTGDYDKLMESIATKLLPLAKDNDVRVYPGHGPETTIAQEMNTNPFITEFINGEINPEMEA